MIPAVGVERILSRTLFDVSLQQSQPDVVSQELYRLIRHAKPLLAPSSTMNPNLFHWKNSRGCSSAATNSVLEVRDTRAAAVLCDIVVEKRVINLSCGAQIAWHVGTEQDDDDDDPSSASSSLTLPDADERAEEEMRMNVDGTLWPRAEARRGDVVRWLQIHAPAEKGSSGNGNDPASAISFDRVIAALTRATKSLTTSMSSSASADTDPFAHSLFVGAFEEQPARDGGEQPGLLSSLLPILDRDARPTAKQLATTIASCPSVYARALALIYVRYRCSPENVTIFFSNQPPAPATPTPTTTAGAPAAPSFFAALGRCFKSFAASPLLDNSILATSSSSSTTTTMKGFARSLLLEDDVLELFLPTYPPFAVQRMHQFVEGVEAAADQEQREVLLEQQQQKQQQQQQQPGDKNNAQPERMFQAVRRQREEAVAAAVAAAVAVASSTAPKSKQDNDGDKSCAGTTALLPGVKSVNQLLAMLKEQEKYNAAAAQVEKQRQAKEDALLRKQYADAIGDVGKTKELQGKQAAALRERRRMEVLGQLESAGELNRREHEAGRNAAAAAAASSKTGQSGGAAVSSHFLDKARGAFGNFPPPFTTLGRSSENALANMVATTAVSTDDVFVTF